MDSFVNILMRFNELYDVLTENDILIEESFLDIIRNPKTLIAAAILFGVMDAKYTIPQLQRIVKHSIQTAPPQKLEQVKKSIPQQIATPIVDKLVKQLGQWSYPKNDIAEPVQPASPDAFLTKAYEYIRKHEGVRNQLYKDIYGNWTIGIGHLVKPEELKGFTNRTLSNEEIETIFKDDLAKKMILIRKHFGKDFDKYSDNLKIVILDGYFRGDLSGSPKARLLIKTRKFSEAAKEYLANAEYLKAKRAGSGVAKRMETNANIIAKEG
jgi:hypothetical protein